VARTTLKIYSLSGLHALELVREPVPDSRFGQTVLSLLLSAGSDQRRFIANFEDSSVGLAEASRAATAIRSAFAIAGALRPAAA
jgi:hypothetical protein